MSGRETKLFVQEVDGELVCPICLGVLNDPVDTPCAHSFCRVCIEAQMERYACWVGRLLCFVCYIVFPL
jgi:hypothetical protein